MKRMIVILGMVILAAVFIVIGITQIDWSRIPGGITQPEEWTEVSSELCNPNADEDTRRLMSYLTEQYGRKILSRLY